MRAGDPGGGGLLDPDGAMERLAAWKGRIGELAADTKAMSDRYQQLRVTAADGNRMVEVTIDSAGALVDLQLSRQIQRVEPDVVARTIMNTIREAREQLADRSQEIIAETVGTESAAAREIAERVGQQLRGPNLDAESGDDDRSWRRA